MFDIHMIMTLKRKGDSVEGMYISIHIIMKYEVMTIVESSCIIVEGYIVVVSLCVFGLKG